MLKGKYITALFIAGLFLLASCDMIYNEESTESYGEVSETVSEQSEETVSEEPSVPEESTIPEESILPEESTETSMEESTVPDENLTANGFVITVVDGVTYIDGILVVNKTYSLPAEYPVTSLTAETYAAYIEMQKAAKEDGISLYSVSDFRSYDYQAGLYDRYCQRDGKEKADTYSARPGHSEHQTGMAIDLNMASSAFTGSKEALWIAEHCAEYGFIIRYPEGKMDITGYKYEPWHVRYVGKEFAQKLYLGDGQFTTMEEYFGITSEYAE